MNKGKVESVYLSGPMRGCPRYNYDRFYWMAGNIEGRFGWRVVNPAETSIAFGTPEEIDGNAKLLDELLKFDLQQLSLCDAIYLMSGWENSVGAKMELKKALECGLKVIVEGHECKEYSRNFTLN